MEMDLLGQADRLQNEYVLEECFVKMYYFVPHSDANFIDQKPRFAYSSQCVKPRAASGDSAISL